MSLEDQVGRLANAIAMHEDVAVREIIKQRDAAQTLANNNAHDSKYYRQRIDELWERVKQEQRKNIALRGVITRMKSQRTGG